MISHFRRSSNRRVDSLGLSTEVQVKGAENHPGMLLILGAVELKKMSAIVRQQNAAFSKSEAQNLIIRYGRVRVSGFQGGQHVVPESSKFHDNLECDVLVCIEPGH